MVTLFVTLVCAYLLITNLDKLKYIKYIPKVIWGTIKSIPDLLYAAMKLVQAGALGSLAFALTYGFWPLALWLMYTIEVKPYGH